MLTLHISSHTKDQEYSLLIFLRPPRKASFELKTMTRYRLQDIPSHLPESDRRLVLEANDLGWEYINEDLAQTQEAKDILHDIATSKYHRDEYRSNML